MKIKVEDSAYKNLKKIPKSKRKKILKRIHILAEHPFLGKKLEGEYVGLRSFRVWPYRVVYKLEKSQIIIYSVQHRQSAYRN